MVHGELGDLINANEERWHRATSCPNTGRSIRMAITPRSKEGQVHYFQIDQPPAATRSAGPGQSDEGQRAAMQHWSDRRVAWNLPGWMTH